MAAQKFLPFSFIKAHVGRMDRTGISSAAARIVAAGAAKAR
jgi:hypothetical protein